MTGRERDWTYQYQNQHRMKMLPHKNQRKKSAVMTRLQMKSVAMATKKMTTGRMKTETRINMQIGRPPHQIEKKMTVDTDPESVAHVKGMITMTGVIAPGIVSIAEAVIVTEAEAGMTATGIGMTVEIGPGSEIADEMTAAGTETAAGTVAAVMTATGTAIVMLEQRSVRRDALGEFQ